MFLLVDYACLTATQRTNPGKNTNSQRDVAVNLPQGMNSGEPDPAIVKESSAVISIPDDNEFYVGGDRFQLGQLGKKVGEILEGKHEEDKIVYLRGGVGVSYGSIVDAIKVSRGADVDRIGLVVEKKTSTRPSRIKVYIPLEPSPNDQDRVKSNPAWLVVTITPDYKLKLNEEDMGAASDSSQLGSRLAAVIQQRKAAHVYRPGMENATNIPEDERIEKTVIIKAARSVKYGDVVKVIDTVESAGAKPVGLQVDGLQ